MLSSPDWRRQKAVEQNALRKLKRRGLWAIGLKAASCKDREHKAIGTCKSLEAREIIGVASWVADLPRILGSHNSKSIYPSLLNFYLDDIFVG